MSNLSQIKKVAQIVKITVGCSNLEAERAAGVICNSPEAIFYLYTACLGTGYAAYNLTRMTAVSAKISGINPGTLALGASTVGFGLAAKRFCEAAVKRSSGAIPELTRALSQSLKNGY